MSYSITDINDNTVRPSGYGVTLSDAESTTKLVAVYGDTLEDESSHGIILPICFDNGNTVACELFLYSSTHSGQETLTLNLKVLGTTADPTDYVNNPVYLAPGWYDVHLNLTDGTAEVILGGIANEIGSTLSGHTTSTDVTITNPRSKYLISGLNLQPSGTYDSVSAWASVDGDATWTVAAPGSSGTSTSSTGIVTQYSGIAIAWRVSTSRYFAPCDWYLSIPATYNTNATLNYNFVNYNSSARAPAAFACGLLWEARYV